MPSPAKLFIIYAREDRAYKNELQKHLLPLVRNGKIEVWDDQSLKAGEKWNDIIRENLSAADIILLLVSSDYFSSDYIHQVELKKALERHWSGKTSIVPIIVRDCVWQEDPLISTLQVLPKDGMAIETWPSHSSAYTNIVRRLGPIIEKVISRQVVPEIQQSKVGARPMVQASSDGELSSTVKKSKSRVKVDPKSVSSNNTTLYAALIKYRNPISVIVVLFAIAALFANIFFNREQKAGDRTQENTGTQTALKDSAFIKPGSTESKPADPIKNNTAVPDTARKKVLDKSQPLINNRIGKTSSTQKPNPPKGTEITPISSVPTNSNFRYYVVAGSFTNVAAARRQMEKLIQMGYEGAEIDYTNDNKYAVVVVKRTNSLGEATKIVDRLEAKGIDATVMDTWRK